MTPAAPIAAPGVWVRMAGLFRFESRFCPLPHESGDQLLGIAATMGEEQRRKRSRLEERLVDPIRIELTTFSLRTRRSPN